MANYESVRAKARDTQRITWLRHFADALRLYYDDNKRYPGNGGPDDWPAGNNPQHFNYGNTQPNGTCTGNYASPLRYENSASQGFLDILYPEYINISGFADPVGKDVQRTPFNCRYVVREDERNATNVQSYLMHCRLENLMYVAEGDGGTAPLYYEFTSGNPEFCLIDHDDPPH